MRKKRKGGKEKLEVGKIFKEGGKKGKGGRNGIKAKSEEEKREKKHEKWGSFSIKDFI